MRRISRISFAILLGMALPLAGGCGYSLQGSHNVLLEKEGIHRVYVAPLLNNTFKPGVENLVYNSLVRTLSAGRRVVLVQSPQQADAILNGVVAVAASGIAGSTSMKQLDPVNGQPTSISGINENISVATIYSAQLTCQFSLTRRLTPPGKKTDLWNSTFSRSKSFAAANRLDVPGTTSALINESEFDRALSELSQTMMGDLHESMLAMF